METLVSPLRHRTDRIPRAERLSSLHSALAVSRREGEVAGGDAASQLPPGDLVVDSVPEKTLFPGLLILGLAIAGLRSSRSRGPAGRLPAPRPRGRPEGGGRGPEGGGLLWPYRISYEVLPGWEGIRTPGRLVTISSLGLALMAAAGAESALRALGRRGLGARPWIAAAPARVLLIVVEGRGLPFDPFERPRPAGRTLLRRPQPLTCPRRSCTCRPSATPCRA
jgi:hypothetical protein